MVRTVCQVVAVGVSHTASLVGGFKHFLFSIIYGIILPIDFHIFQDVFKPPTSSAFQADCIPYDPFSLKFSDKLAKYGAPK